MSRESEDDVLSCCVGAVGRLCVFEPWSLASIVISSNGEFLVNGKVFDVDVDANFYPPRGGLYILHMSHPFQLRNGHLLIHSLPTWSESMLFEESEGDSCHRLRGMGIGCNAIRGLCYMAAHILGTLIQYGIQCRSFVSATAALLLQIPFGSSESL